MKRKSSAANAEKLAEAIKGGSGANPDKLVNTYKLVGAAFAPEEAPVDRILRRAGERAVLETALAGKAGSRRFAWRLAAVAGTVAVLVAVLMFAKPAPPSAQTIIAKAMAAIEQPNMITYYKVTGTTKTRFGARTYMEEHWVDYKNEMEKSLYRSGDGKSESSSLIKDGLAIGIEKSGDLVDVSGNKALKPFSDTLKDSVKSFRADINSGRAKLVGEEVIDGVATYKIRIEQEPRYEGRVDKKKEGMAETINIRKDNFLPVRRVSERLLVGPDGEKTVDTGEVSAYSAVKLIAPATLGANFFTLDIPKDAPYQYTYIFTPAEAKAFKEFDLYDLGDSFAGLDVQGFFEYHKEINQPYSVEGLPESYVKFDYMNPVDVGGVQIMIRPRFDLSVLINASYPASKQTAIEINGHEGVLIEKDWGRVVTRVLLMQMGRSTVMIVAKDNELLLAAAKTLKKIN